MSHRVANSCLFALAGVLVAVAAVRAADPPLPAAWELSPYRIKLIVAVDAGTGLAGSVADELPADLAARVAAVVGGAWRVEVVPPSAELRHAMLADGRR